MEVKYTTKEGDCLDLICMNYYGYCRGVMERVLEINPGLCAYVRLLPVNIEIVLPNIDPDIMSSVIRIWS